MEVIKSNSFSCVCFHCFQKQATNTLNRLVYFVLHSRKEFVQQNLHRKKKLFWGSFFSSTAVLPRSLRLYSLYSKLFFMAICDYKKSSFEPFVYSARLFLLLIDFLLHIMGIQNRMKESGGDVVSIWIELDFGDACLAFVALRTNGFVRCLSERLLFRSVARWAWCNFQRCKRKWKFINSAFYRFSFSFLLASRLIHMSFPSNKRFK